MDDTTTNFVNMAWDELNHKIYSLTENEVHRVLTAEASKDAPRQMHLKRLYGRFSALRRHRESIEFGISW